MNTSRLLLITASVASLGGCIGAFEGPESATTSASTGQNNLPQTPALLWDVADITGVGSDGGGHFTRPTIPPFRTSSDGRIGLNLKTQGTNDGLGFYVISPEKLGVQFSASGPGADILSSGTPYANGLAPSKFNASKNKVSWRHSTLCDATPQFPDAGTPTNPYPCGGGSGDAGSNLSDCYDLTVISSFAYSTDAGASRIELWGTPITVQVDNPKTASATLSSVNLGTPVLGGTFDWVDFREPMVVNDGHLLVARLGGSKLYWRSDGGAPTTVNIVYSPGNPSSPRCDISQWQQFFPLSHAPYDSAVAQYGFAQYPYRDTEGNSISDGVDIEGTYPWVDRKGNNVFFTTVAATLFYEFDGGVSSRYPNSCVPGVKCIVPQTPAGLGNVEEPGNIMGVSMIGLWTHGKLVLLDNTNNNVDYSMMVPDDTQRMLDLYQDADGGTHSIRTGSGRWTGNSPTDPPGFTENTTFTDSVENLFNYHDLMKPMSVRDVAWIVNSGRGSTEVAFDDYLDPNGFIVSEMSASLSFAGGPIHGFYDYHDGFDQTSSFGGTGFNREIRLQNAATAVPARWTIPAYGLVVGTSRIEPVALGGIHGKGFWLDGSTTGVQYAVSSQCSTCDTVASSSWFIGLFVDSRFSDDGTARRLLTFPDGSWIDLVGLSAIDLYLPSGTLAKSVSLPSGLKLASPGWTHLGVLVQPGGNSADIYLNGFLLDSWTGSSGQSLFQMTKGDFVVGAGTTAGSPSAYFEGWIDELKVMAESPNSEVICNHARGTLIGLPSSCTGACGSWVTIAGLYPSTETTTLNSKLGSTYSAFACYVDYTTELGASVVNTPANTTSVRNALNFPAGLHWDKPRPGEAKNTFCQSCHVAGQFLGLTPAALTYDGSVLMENDVRRQPLQPLRLIYGNVPAGFIASGSPSSAQQGTALGLYLDQWVFP
jgi:hypothetical protein